MANSNDLYTLACLLVTLAIVWRLSQQSQPSVPPSRKRNGGTSSATTLVVGICIGVSMTLVRSILSSQSSAIAPADILSTLTSTSICPATNKTTIPAGTEGLPPGIIVNRSDLYVHRLLGRPEEDLPSKPKNLLVLAVTYISANRVNKLVSKFKSTDWTVMLFHEDGKVDEWLEYEWANNAIHIAAQKQTKWWFAKRFLHPDVMEPYEYIFLWDQDVDVSNFDPSEYLRLVKKNGFEISQPAVDFLNSESVTWQMVKHQITGDVHRMTEEKPGWCEHPQKPPCAGFVEIQTPVFSRKAWRCTWHMVQNDLVHGWGLNFNLGKCAQGPPHEKIGVVDAQYIRHLPRLMRATEPHEEATEKRISEEIERRRHYEWDLFRKRMEAADEAVKESLTEKEATIILHN